MNDQMRVIIRNLKQKINATKERIMATANELEADNIMLSDLIETYNVLKVHDEPEMCAMCRSFLAPTDRAFNRETGTDHDKWVCYNCS